MVNEAGREADSYGYLSVSYESPPRRDTKIADQDLTLIPLRGNLEKRFPQGHNACMW